MTAISDHGTLDFLTPEPTDIDRARARIIRDQIDAQRIQRNLADKLKQAAKNEREIARLVGVES